MGKFTLGGSAQTVALNFNTNAPLDDRTVVTTKASLIGKDTWIKAEYLFKGLITSVQETNELYMYIGNIGTTFPADFLTDTTTTNPNVSDETIAKYWKKVSSSGLENLSGVFAFKGVAEAVSSDLKYIAICSDISDQSIVPIGTAVDLVGDLYYGWSIKGNEFWTKSSILDNTKQQYVRGQAVEVWGVKYKDEFYFPVTDVMPTGGDDEDIELQNSNGDSIFLPQNSCPTSQNSEYPVYDNEGKDIGEGVGFSYTGYEFDEITTPHTISNTHTMIQANEDNSGHVYQIGENEYASNGQIWVKLGSPVEDWIIL